MRTVRDDPGRMTNAATRWVGHRAEVHTVHTHVLSIPYGLDIMMRVIIPLSALLDPLMIVANAPPFGPSSHPWSPSPYLDS
jgi:hypothetical protein